MTPADTSRSLDNNSVEADRQLVLRLTKFAALLLIALWLPATLHCALEEAGVIGKTCTDNCQTGENGEKDGCSTLESGAYKLATVLLKVSGPALVVCLCFLCLHLVSLVVQRDQGIVLKALFQLPRSWISVWHFVRRAAPFPGAPSLSLA